MFALLALLLGAALHINGTDNIVYIVPGHIVNPYKAFYDPHAERDETCQLSCTLRERLEQEGYTVQFTYSADRLHHVAAIISFNTVHNGLLANLCKHPQKKCFFVALEPATLCPEMYDPKLATYFGTMFVMYDTLVDHQQYKKIHYAQPRLAMIKTLPQFSEKKFCTLIASNRDSSHPDTLFKRRREAIEFFTTQHPEQFDLYGRKWDGVPCWRGIIPSKWDVLKQYKFCICFENTGNQKGYVTEKIFDCMVAGCVPIYLGADNITDYVPAPCFIDMRNFDSYDQLYRYLVAMPEAHYNQYLEAIRAYFNSRQCHKFSITHFVSTLIKAIKEAQ